MMLCTVYGMKGHVLYTQTVSFALRPTKRAIGQTINTDRT